MLPCSISPTAPSPQLRGPASPAWCAGELAPPETRAREKKGPAVSAGSPEEVEAEGRGGERPGCSVRVDLSAVMLSNSPQRRSVGGGGNREEKEDDEGEGIVLSHRREAGGLREGLCVCLSVDVDAFISGLRRRCFKKICNERLTFGRGFLLVRLLIETRPV